MNGTVTPNRGLGMGGHTSRRTGTDEWLTPREVISELGAFDLDPCSPVDRPWPTAERHFTLEDDGLSQCWSGRVWLNPPYSEVGRWIRRLAEHGNGIALVFARTETVWFQEAVFKKATGILFVRNRIHFCRVDGSPSKYNSGAPSVLVAYGDMNAEAIRASDIRGTYLPVTHVR